MKKIFLVILAIVGISCSKDKDVSQPNLPNPAITQLSVTKENLAGRWIPIEYKQVNGITTTENNLCSTKSNYIVIDITTTIPNYLYYKYLTDCTTINIVENCAFQIVNGKTIENCPSAVFKGDITSLTATTMTIEKPFITEGSQINAIRFTRAQ